MGTNVVYGEYLQSDTWKERRHAILVRDKHVCVNCGKSDGLSVHHLTYERLGYENDTDLVTLCAGCHRCADLFRLRLEYITKVTDIAMRSDDPSVSFARLRHWFRQSLLGFDGSLDKAFDEMVDLHIKTYRQNALRSGKKCEFPLIPPHYE